MCQGRLDRFLKISLDKRLDNVNIFTLDPNRIDNNGQDVVHSAVCKNILTLPGTRGFP